MYHREQDNKTRRPLHYRLFVVIAVLVLAVVMMMSSGIGIIAAYGADAVEIPCA